MRSRATPSALNLRARVAFGALTPVAFHARRIFAGVACQTLSTSHAPSQWSTRSIVPISHIYSYRLWFFFFDHPFASDLTMHLSLQASSGLIDGLLGNAAGRYLTKGLLPQSNHKRLGAFCSQTHLVFLEMRVGEDITVLGLRFLGELQLLPQEHLEIQQISPIFYDGPRIL